MRRWLFAALVSLVVVALLVWQWRAAEPLDLTNAAVRYELRPPLPPIDVTVEPVEDSWGGDEGLTHTVVIGHWEYTASPKLRRYDSNALLRIFESLSEFCGNQVRPSELDPDKEPAGGENHFEWYFAVEVHKRPFTLMARLRAALGAD